MACVHRTTVTRQAANLYAVKKQLHAHLAERLAAWDHVFLVDSLPIDACAFSRAQFCQRFRGEAAYGHDHIRRTTLYGFRLHVRTTPAGAIIAFDLAPANVSDLSMVDQLDLPPGTACVGDRNYWSPRTRDALAEQGVKLVAPFRTKSKDPNPERSKRLSKFRWIIETTFGQLAERFRIKRTWARDLWHLSHRVIRKVLSHTVAVWLNLTSGRPALDFDGLVTG